MTYYTHINRGRIDSNRKHGTDIPVVRIQKGKYGKPMYAHRVRLPEGSEIAYSAHEPLLPCGARLVIISEEQPTIVR
jgi:hypothetical protein